MRWIRRFALLATLVLVATGCESLRMNEGRMKSILAAAQVGRFKLQNGAWPGGIEALTSHECPGLDVNPRFAFDEPPPRAGECRFFAELPYGLALRNLERDLEVEFRDVHGKLVCRIIVLDPEGGASPLMARVQLKTTLRACPGEGEKL